MTDMLVSQRNAIVLHCYRFPTLGQFLRPAIRRQKLATDETVVDICLDLLNRKEKSTTVSAFFTWGGRFYLCRVYKQLNFLGFVHKLDVLMGISGST